MSSPMISEFSSVFLQNSNSGLSSQSIKMMSCSKMWNWFKLMKVPAGTSLSPSSQGPFE